MLCDFKVYALLKIRLARRALSTILAGFLFTDFKENKSLENRLYQVYVLLILVIALVLLWFAVLYYVEIAFIYLGPQAADLLFFCTPLIPLILFIFSATANSLSSPLKFSQPDIAYVAASPIKTAAIVFWELMWRVLLSALVGGIMGFILVTGFENVIRPMATSLTITLGLMISLSAATTWSWCVGVVRLALPAVKKWWAKGVYGLCLIVLFLIACFLIIVMASVSDFLPHYLVLLLLLAICLIGFLVLISVANRVDIIRVVDESAIFAETQSLQLAPLYLLTGTSEIKRMKRLARRGPWVAIKIGEGNLAIVARSLLSQVRQYESLPHIILWGAVVAPLATSLVFSPLFFFGWLGLLVIVLLLSSGVREIVRPYKDDNRNTLVRNHLVHDNLELLILNALPGFILATLFSILVVIVFLGPTPHLIFAVPFCLVINALFILCAGAESLPIPGTGKKASYELLAVVFLFFFFLSTLFLQPLIVLATALLYTLITSYIIKKS